MKRILVVDDDQTIRELVVEILTALGYTCEAAADGLEAAARLNETKFAVVITDIVMPKMDGMQLLGHIMIRHPGTDVLVITGHADTFIYSNIANAGGSDFIVKPFDTVELETKLRRIFRERKLIRGLEREIGERHDAEERLLAAHREVAVANEYKNLLINDLFATMDEMLANRDHYTFEHGVRVAEISKRIGRLMGLSPEELELLERACLVHDIGKVAIPDDVLLKPGQFDALDRDIMRVHPRVGANLFTRKHHDSRIPFIIRHHHERLDGSGYPDGLSGADLGIMVRIVAVADIYEALVAQRPYKKPMSKEAALDMLRTEARLGRVDQSVVTVLEEVLQDWDPLSIKREFTFDYMKELEVFRQKAYFREPLTGFYNYRYLYFLDDTRVLRRRDRPFDLLVTNFLGLADCYRRLGQVLTDQILDEIGQRLHDAVEEFNREGGGEDIARLFSRRGDYFLYVECDEGRLSRLFTEISAHLAQVEREWLIPSQPYSRQYGKGYSLEKALNELFQG
jgi:putative nucleotidyltransferase with HDIG domain